jgi:hypothetical protein
VYAISDNRLIKLEQVHATLVDRRAGNQLQILEPGLSVIAPGTITRSLWLVFNTLAKLMNYSNGLELSRVRSNPQRISKKWAVWDQEGGRTERAKRWNPI